VRAWAHRIAFFAGLGAAGALAFVLASAARPSSGVLRARNGAIACTRTGRYGSSQVWRMTATGAHGRPLTTGRVHVSSGASYSPNGSRIVFARGVYDHVHYVIGCPCDLWTVNADGRHKRRLTFSPLTEEDDPAWSPNGKKIAFTVSAPGKRSGLWIMDADGRHRRRLAAAHGLDTNPSWSPNGTEIAYANDSFGVGNPPISGIQIYVVKASGGSPTNLTNDPSVSDVEPSWSPNGRKILFSSDRGDPPNSNFQSDLWTMDPDGSGAQRVTNTPDADEYSPTWSPDGRLIAYALHDSQSNPTGVHDNRITQIYVARRDGSQARMITHPCRINCTRKDDISNGEPSWQPLHR
jgi:TolB protein